MHRYFAPLAAALVFASALPASADGDVPIVFYSYDQVTLGDAQTYALVPHTTRIEAGYGWADLQKRAFELVKQAKPATYGLSTVYVNPDRTVSVNLDESKRPYFPIIVGEVVFTLSELGAKAVSFPSFRSQPVARADVETPAFTLITPLWRALPPAKVPVGLVRMPGGALETSDDVEARIGRHDGQVIRAALDLLKDDGEAKIRTGLAALNPLKVPRQEDHLLPLLEHPSGDIRLAVVGMLSTMKLRKVLRALSERVSGDNDPRVSAEAAQVLAGSGVPEFASFALIYALRGADTKAAADAARRLGAMKNEQAVPELGRAARSPDAGLRLSAVDAIAAIGDHQVLKDLLSFQDLQADAKVRAASLLGQHPDPEMAQNGLAYLLLNATGDYSAGAATKLGESRDPRVVPWLIQALKHSEQQTRQAAGGALALIGDPRALAPLSQAAKASGPEGQYMSQQVIGIMSAQSLESILQFAGHNDEELRRLATEALGHHVRKNPARAGRKAIPVLGQRVGDYAPRVRVAAVNGLGIAGGTSALPFILQAVNDPEAEVRKAVATALQSFKPPEGTEQAVQLIGDEDDGVRLRAIEAVMARKEEAAVETLINYSRHGNPEIKRRVFQALSAINPPSLHRTLREVFSEGVFDQDGEIRLASVNGLKTIKDPRVLDIMSVLLQDPDMAVRVAVHLAYGESGYPQALQPLLAAAGDPGIPITVREAAIAALGKLGRKEAIPHLKQLLKSEVDAKVKARLDAAIQILKNVR